VADQKYHRVRRRLLEQFQQRVGGVHVHLVSGVDDHHPASAIGDGESEKGSEFAHLVHGDFLS